MLARLAPPLRAVLPVLAVVGLVLFAALRADAVDAPAAGAEDNDSLTGRLLVADPSMRDPRFHETVILMVEHDATGALGLVVNRTIGTGPLSALLGPFGIERPDEERHGDAAGEAGDAAEGPKVRLNYGGPVEPDRGFVLHSTDFAVVGTRRITEGVALTTNRKILRAIAEGRGPERRLLLLGYAGWGPGQLESEIARGAWHSVPADTETILGADDAGKWQRTMDKVPVAL
jgi:putative transcriptional regulator